jgi:ketosteroid isomerase-like protein
MSQENVEIVRAAMAVYQHPEGMALLASGDIDLGLFDPDIEWDASRLEEMIPDLAEVYRGHDGVRTYWRRWFEGWKNLEFELEDVREAGDEVVALIRNQRQWGRHTGIATELPPYAMVFTFRDGKVVRWRTFPTQEAALDAVGLPSRPAP